MIVAYHRGRMEKIKGPPFYSKYQEMTKDKDLVIGSIANDRMFFVIDNFYLMFHTMAPEVAIEDLKEIYRQKALFAVCEARGHSVEELLKVKEAKNEKRGGFMDKIYWIGNEE